MVRGRTVDELIPNIDLFPTICELTETSPPEDVHGRSWAPLVDGNPYEAADAFFPEMTYHDYYDPIRGVRTSRYKLLMNFSSGPEFMSPTQSWFNRSAPAVPAAPTLAYHAPVELYDLTEDPWERTNLADDPAHEEVRERLVRRLHHHMEATLDPLLAGPILSPLHKKTAAILTHGVS